MRIAILGIYHETNTFAVEKNDDLSIVPVQRGAAVLKEAHPRSYIGGFAEEALRHPDVELVPVANIDFIAGGRGGTITAPVFKECLDILLCGLKAVGQVDAVYFAMHGAMEVEAPYGDAEAIVIREARKLVGPDIPFVGTYDFHSNYTEDEVSDLVPFPLNTNPHIDAYERGIEAAACLMKMLAGEWKPVTRRVYVPIIGPNIGQSSWNIDPEVEQGLPVFQVNAMREELEKMPGVINATVQGGYGYSDLGYTGMCVIVTTDNDPALADKLARQLAQELWDKRKDILQVRPIVPVDEGVKRAMAFQDGLVCLVDIGDDPGSLTPADSPVVLEALIRLGAKDAALTIRDAEVVEAAHKAGVGATLTMEFGAKVDQRFYKPVKLTGTVKSLDDGKYKIVGPFHGGWSKEVEKESFRDVESGRRAVIRFGNKIDAIFGVNQRTGKDRDFFKSAGIVMEEKQIIVVKSNQAHRASFDPIVDLTIELDTPGVCTANYTRLPFQNIPRPLFPLDQDMEWKPE